MEDAKYLQTLCPACDGSIEFPAHALWEQIDCPHCGKIITLGTVSPAEPEHSQIEESTPVDLEVWRHKPATPLTKYQPPIRQLRAIKINWQITALLSSCLLIIGTALFIYEDSKEEQQKRYQKE